MIDEKNREIMQLRMANEESRIMKQNQAGSKGKKKSKKQYDSKQREKLVSDLTNYIEQLKIEFNRIKQTMFSHLGKNLNFDVPGPQLQSNRMLNREEDLHSEVIIQMSEIRAQINLAQEIAMLAQSSLTAAPGLNRSASPNLSNSTSQQPQMLLKSHKSNADQITST